MPHVWRPFPKSHITYVTLTALGSLVVSLMNATSCLVSPSDDLADVPDGTAGQSDQRSRETGSPTPEPDVDRVGVDAEHPAHFPGAGQEAGVEHQTTLRAG